MAVNREQRRKVADNLTALMRGEVTITGYVERGRKLAAEIKQSQRKDKFAEYNATYEWPVDIARDRRPIIDEQIWNMMRCRLAFLESDLEMKRVGDHRQPPLPRWLLLIVVCFVVAVAISYVCWTGADWTLILAVWAGTGIGVRLAMDLVFYGIIQRWRSASCPAPNPYHPFNDEAQFRRHEHLLDRFGLPPYDPAAHSMSGSNPVRKLLIVILSVPMMILFYAVRSMVDAVVGPLALGVFFLERPDDPQYTAVPAEESA